MPFCSTTFNMLNDKRKHQACLHVLWRQQVKALFSIFLCNKMLKASEPYDCHYKQSKRLSFALKQTHGITMHSRLLPLLPSLCMTLSFNTKTLIVEEGGPVNVWCVNYYHTIIFTSCLSELVRLQCTLYSEQGHTRKYFFLFTN